MYFLASVANADVFDGNQLIMTSKTLLDSSITIGVTPEDVRAGQGAKLYGRHFHSSTLDLTFSDQMFRIDYIAKNVGSTVQIGGDAMKVETITLGSGGTGTVVGTPVAFGSYGTIGWVAPTGTQNFTLVTFSGKNFTVSGASENDVYCVKFFETDSAAKKVLVSGNIVPGIVTVVLTANLYDGDPNSVETSTIVGKVSIKIPRLQLNGEQELAMSMTGVSQTSLSGTALVAEENCAGDSHYAEIVQSIFSANWYDEATALAISDADFALAVGGTRILEVFAIYPGNVAPKLVANSDLTFVSEAAGTATVDAAGEVEGITAGSTAIRVKITAKPAVEGVAFVTVS